MAEPRSRQNVDPATVAGFGEEWATFDQRDAPEDELAEQFAAYFRLFPWELIGASAVGADIGCGSGRWARFVAPRVRRLHCVDPSAGALAVARRNLADLENCELHHASADTLPFPDESLDFAYALGVLHHIPDTAAALRAVTRKLRPGAPLLVYLYYAFDNRPFWYRWLWRISDLVRRLVSRMPFAARYVIAQVLALLVYWPLARIARIAEMAGIDVGNFPLAAYRSTSFYCMRTDSLDRFGTRLERRFSRDSIARMMLEAGLEDIRFSDESPYWCAVGCRARV